MTNNSAVAPALLPGYTLYSEPRLLFSAVDKAATDFHPLVGLLKYGPYSSSLLFGPADPIKVAVISPSGMMSKAKALIQEFSKPHSPKERRDYLPDFPGFREVFKTSLNVASTRCCIELGAEVGVAMRASDQPHQVLADYLVRSLHQLKLARAEFDVVLMVLPDDWSAGFTDRDGSFDLHDFLKAVSASAQMPLQIVNESSAMRYKCRCSVMWRMAIALYTKAGGQPWTLLTEEDDVAYIGISYALRGPKEERSDRYAICCSQVFDANGAGLELIAYEADGVRIYRRNPFMTRQQMLSVISRSLSIYQRQHAGKAPRRVVVFKNTEFKPEEVAGCQEALSSCEQVDLIQVVQQVSWKGIQVSAAHAIDGYPVIRGTSLQLEDNATLLWVHGNSKTLGLNGRSTYKGGKSTPTPLMLVRHAGSGPMHDICRSVLALSKMNWNNDGPYDLLPVTMSYAHTMAGIIKRMPHLEAVPYPIRYFM